MSKKLRGARLVLCAVFLVATITPAATRGLNSVSLLPDIGGGLSATAIQVAANTSAVVIKGGSAANPGLLYAIAVYNNSTTVYYGKVYDAASGTTCGSGTPKDRFVIPGATGGTAAVYHPSDIGVSYLNGITVCVTAGFADSDTSNPTANQAEYTVYFN